MSSIVECIPNFSEGRSKGVIEALVQAISEIDGTAFLDRHVDADHHRAVLTFAGSPEAVEQAAFAVAKTASQLIDVSTYSGVHPRIGAADVLPFVPLRGAAMNQCVQMARTVGARIGDELKIPVFLYEEAAVHSHRVRLETIRRGGLEALAARMKTDPLWLPDFGPSVPHPTAGATVVGARHPLIAYNVLLDSDDLAIAQDIARTIRASEGGLPFVKALGLFLSSRGQVQVSMNLTNFRKTPLQVAFESVKREAQRRGVAVLGSELVGLVPREAVSQVEPQDLGLAEIPPDQVLETRLLKFYNP